jgi:hypothetical protein
VEVEGAVRDGVTKLKIGEAIVGDIGGYGERAGVQGGCALWRGALILRAAVAGQQYEDAKSSAPMGRMEER